MLKKYITKFTVDILPSVAATVIGAYIVNHYIVTKPGTDAPVAAAVSTAKPDSAKVDSKSAAKAPETSSDVTNVREPGVKAKGISEKAIFEKTASEKPAENVTEKPSETASIPADTRRHSPAPREKAAAKTATAPVTAPVPAPVAVAAPVVSAPNPAPPAEAANAQEDRRDANDLARAAIERLRGSNDGAPSKSQDKAQEKTQEAARAPEAVRAPDAARIPDAPRVVTGPAMRPLPPPIMVSTPANEAIDSRPGSSPRQPYAEGARNDDPSRPTPPAEIPSKPLDLRAEAAAPAVRERTSVAEDMLSAAKSVFHAVIPK
jgi:hypothetical protein